MPAPRGITVECDSKECGQSFIFREGIDYRETWNGKEKHFHRECWENGFRRLYRDVSESPSNRIPDE